MMETMKDNNDNHVRKSKILIIDDSRSISDMLKNILETAGYDVMAAYTGEQGLETYRKFKPDIVLLDVVMPGIDGYEVCRKIRADHSTGFMKILMISSERKLEERLKGYDAGADDYISKPFNEDELLAKVRVFMRLKLVEDKLIKLNESLNEQVRIRTGQLLDAEKMAAIGKYTAGIVHNLNNPLQVIMGTAQLLTLKYHDDPNIMAQRKAAAQMKRIITTILGTSHRESKQDLVSIDLNEVLRDQLELLKANPFFKSNIRTMTELKPLPLYLGVYSHFSQSIGNLIKNAVEAMHEKKEGVLLVTSEVKDGKILLKICDTGLGIQVEAMNKIFNPFFTTKPLTSIDDRPTGTGLGLASCKEMIESYGGKLMVDSKIGKGTVFTVRLPIKENPLEKGVSDEKTDPGQK